ncbi:MAG: putative dehydrogenase, partial [Verrucomicrobiales bacterium]
MINRRAFLQSTPAAAGLAIPLAPALAASDAPIRVGVIGASGRARSLYQIFAKNPEVDVVSIADVDTKNFARAVEEIGASQGGSRPETHQDFRQLVNDD